MSYRKVKNSIKERFSSHLHEKLYNHVSKHGHKHIHKWIHIFHHFFHRYLHLWELVLVVALSFVSIIFASEPLLTNNEYFDYPLKQVSTLECRVLHWDEMPASCKIDLPVIQWANYSKFEDIKLYRDIYTVLWGAPYTETWNQKIGAHPGVDIATAEGTPLYAIWNGKVFYAWWQAWYGNVVKIEYKYQWETVYSIYWHMESILVQNWDLVSRWQQVGTVWNSGSVTWALWGYHVHFELTKDNMWRPMYSYLWCADLSKWDSTITNEWLCRVELFDHTYDPIKVIESSLALFAYNHKQDAVDTEEKSDDIINDEQDHDSADFSTWIINDSGNFIDDVVVDIQDPIIEVWTSSIVTGNISWIVLDYTLLDWLEKHFVSQWDISIEKDFDSELWLWDKWNITIGINSKKHLGKFNWIMSPSLKLVSNNNVIDLWYKSLQLVQNGKADISFKVNSKWNSTIVVYLGNYKIGMINIEIK